MGKLLSVIVPVYKVEDYLEKCVNSILDQTYKNLELLLVNDGSKDNSLALCHRLSDADARIRVFDKPNGGAASARNLGLREANGEYIGFCDADDFFDLDAFETLISIMEEKGLPTIECLSRAVDIYGKLIACDDDSRQLIEQTAEEAIRDIFLRKGSVSLATRITKAEYIKDICIPEGRRVEDFYFTILLLLKTGSTAIYHYPYYTCFCSEGSVTRSKGGNIYFDALYFYDKALEVLKDTGYQMYSEQRYYLFKMYYLLSISLTSKECKTYKNEIKAIKKNLKKCSKEIDANSHLLGKEKKVLRLAVISFSLTRFMYTIKNLLKGN